MAKSIDVHFSVFVRNDSTYIIKIITEEFFALLRKLLCYPHLIMFLMFYFSIYRAEKLTAQKPEATDRTRWQHTSGEEPGTSQNACDGATASPDTGEKIESSFWVELLYVAMPQGRSIYPKDSAL